MSPAAFQQEKPVEEEVFFFCRNPLALPDARVLSMTDVQMRAYCGTFFGPPEDEDVGQGRIKLSGLKDDITRKLGAQDRVRTYAPQRTRIVRTATPPTFRASWKGWTPSVTR